MDELNGKEAQITITADTSALDEALGSVGKGNTQGPTINIDADISSVEGRLNSAKAMADGMSANIKVGVDSMQAMMDIAALKIKLTGQPASITVNANTGPASASIDALRTKIAPGALNGQATVTANVAKAIAGISMVRRALSGLGNKKITVSASVSGQSAIDALRAKIRSLQNTSINIKVNFSIGVMPSIPGLKSNADGDKNVDKDQISLVGELGPEMVVDRKRGRWRIVGQHGAEFTPLRKGDIVFNADQTKRLLSTGKINSRGKALVDGNAGGNAFLTGGGKFSVSGSNSSSSSSKKDNKSSSSNNTSKSTKNNKKNSTANVKVSADVTDLEEKLKDQIDKVKKEFEKVLNKFDFDIFMLQKKNAHPDEIVALYKKTQSKLHEQAERYRKMGLTENDASLQEVIKSWWEAADNIKEVIEDAYEKVISENENAIEVIEHQLKNAMNNHDDEIIFNKSKLIEEYYKKLQDLYHEQAEYYRHTGFKDNSDEISKLSSSWWDAEEKIRDAKQDIIDYYTDVRDAAKDALSEIDSALETFKTAASEYSSGKFITIDTYQDLMDMGPEYMQMLRDENGQLVINEDRINAVTAARVKQLALESAWAYVQRVKLALESNNVESLDKLLNATADTSNATWELVYATAAYMDMSEENRNKLIHGINVYYSLMQTAVNGIGKTIDEEKDKLEDWQDGLDDILKYTMEMIRDEYDHQIEALEKEADAMSEIVNLRKEALDKAKEESDYQDDIADKLKSVAKLQSQIAALALDDSRDSIAKRKKLEEQLAEENKELAKSQSDHARDSQKEALDDISEAYSKAKDERIEALKDEISSEEKVYRLALERIRTGWDTLKDDLIKYNYQCGNSLEKELLKAWDAAQAAAEEYGDYLTAIIENQKRIDSWDSKSKSTNDSNVVSDVHDVNGVSAMSNADKEKAKQYLDLMEINAKAWWNYNDGSPRSKKVQQNLEDENAHYGDLLKGLGLNVERKKDGTWYLADGRKLFDVYRTGTLFAQLDRYHVGGVVGHDGSLKQDEVMSVLQKGELVLNNDKQNSLFRLVDFATTVSDKFKGMVQAGGYSPVAANSNLPGFNDYALANGAVNTTITFGDVVINGGSPETVAAHREVNRKFTNEILKQLNIRR